jgi:tRNA-splicing ligase RtcB
MSHTKLRKVTDYLWEIPREGKMRVPGRIYATEDMLPDVTKDNAHVQVANVATLPGIVKYSMAMPDIHWGYGFPIGGVAAFDVETGVISPGGVGYDINCGVRLLRTDLKREEIQDKIREVVSALFQHVPSGVGSTGAIKLSNKELEQVLVEGAHWAVRNGFGTEEDLEHIEESGRLPGADPSFVSARAMERGRPQLGTLGSGNHFVEVGYVEEVHDESLAKKLGLFQGQVTMIVHTGSRGFGHQVCDDYIRVMLKASEKYGIELPDKQLCCAPVGSPEGKQYYAAMACAVNFAFANRQMITHWAREAFVKALGLPASRVNMRVVYEVAHNIAKLEEHEVDGRKLTLCVHRKGATRAFGPGHPAVPAAYRDVGQPVLIPGDMGRYSYVLIGTEKAMQETFGSTCHGAGRVMSRHEATRVARGRALKRELEDRGIFVMASSKETIAEEMPEAYKDVSRVVEAVALAGISVKVAKLRPLGVVKG